jgi:hypothetical protein
MNPGDGGGEVSAQEKLKTLPTEYFEGEWRLPTADGAEPWAVVTYAEEPSPETGHVGWCWWAPGEMGDAPTYDSACAAAVASLLVTEGDK